MSGALVRGRRLLAAMFGVCLGVIVLQGVAMADEAGPFVSSVYPGNDTQASIQWVKSGPTWFKQLQLVVTVDDPDGILSNSQQVNILPSTQGTQTLSVEYLPGTGETQARLKYTRNSMTEGLYTVNVAVKDKLGNVTTHSWRFNAYNSPHVYGHTPERGDIAASPVYAISANLSGGTYTSGTSIGTRIPVNTSSIAMTIDGAPVAPTVMALPPDNRWCSVSWTPPVPLVDGPHVAQVTFKNSLGAQGSYSWSFVTYASQPACTDILPSPGSVAAVDGDGEFQVAMTVQDSDAIAAAGHVLTVRAPSGEETTREPATVFTPAADHRVARLSATFMAAEEDATHTLVAAIKDGAGNTGTQTWTFKTPSLPPVFDRRTPATTSEDRDSAVSVRVRDWGTGVDAASIVMTVDGRVVSHETSAVAGGYVVFWSPEGTFGDNTSHDVTVTASDSSGAVGSDSWSFDIKVPPKVSSRTPSPGSVYTSEDVDIFVRFIERDDGIDPSSVSMTFDGESVTPTVTLDASGTVMDVAATVRSVGGTGTLEHTVTVSASDTRGTRGTETWSFEVHPPTGRSDMSITDDNAPCGSCHITSGDYDEWNRIHWIVGDRSQTDHWDIPSSRSSHKYNCNICHYAQWDAENNRYVGELYVPELYPCGLCHPSPGDEQQVETGPHGGNDGRWFPYRYRDHDDGAKYALTAPREGRDCVYCHQGTKGAQRLDNFANGGTQEAHDIVGAHRVDFPEPSCGNCHSAVLTREHAADGRADASGRALGCASCHASDAAAVKAAIHSFPALRYRFWGEIAAPWRTYPVPEPPVGEQRYALEDGGEYSIPGERITGARLRLVSSTLGTFTVEAYYGGLWHDVHTATIGGAGDGSPGSNQKVKPFPKYPEHVESFTFPAAERIRVRYESQTSGYHYVNANVDRWVLEGDQSIDCFDCHTGMGHAEQHVTGLDSRCTSCHNANLASEHVETRQRACADCHTTDAQSRSAIAFGQTDCSDCHEIAHGQNYVSSVPTDVPQHPDLKWSQTMPAALFTGEEWLPAAAEQGGKLCFSARRGSAPSPSDVWAWYQTALAGQGWTVESGAPEDGADFYAARFKKGTKHVVLYCYRGAGHLASPPVGQGYRYELLWWVD